MAVHPKAASVSSDAVNACSQADVLTESKSVEPIACFCNGKGGRFSLFWDFTANFALEL